MTARGIGGYRVPWNGVILRAPVNRPVALPSRQGPRMVAVTVNAPEICRSVALPSRQGPKMVASGEARHERNHWFSSILHSPAPAGAREPFHSIEHLRAACTATPDRCESDQPLGEILALHPERNPGDRRESGGCARASLHHRLRSSVPSGPIRRFHADNTRAAVRLPWATFFGPSVSV